MNPLQSLVRRRSPKIFSKKNPRMVFVLSSPRSGSTMLRAMLDSWKSTVNTKEFDQQTVELAAELGYDL